MGSIPASSRQTPGGSERKGGGGVAPTLLGPEFGPHGCQTLPREGVVRFVSDQAHGFRFLWTTTFRGLMEIHQMFGVPECPDHECPPALRTPMG